MLCSRREPRSRTRNQTVVSFGLPRHRRRTRRPCSGQAERRLACRAV